MTKRLCAKCMGFHEPLIDCERRIFHDDELIPLSSPGDVEDFEDWLRGDHREPK